MTISSEEGQSNRIEALLEKLTDEIDSLKQETERTNDRVETNQKASQQVVNFAFGLILTSSLAIIIPAILGR